MNFVVHLTVDNFVRVLQPLVVKPHRPAWNAIVKHFGRDILLPNEEIDREKLGKIIFGDGAKRRILNKCTHPAIYSSILWALLKYFFKGMFLYESNYLHLDVWIWS